LQVWTLNLRGNRITTAGLWVWRKKSQKLEKLDIGNHVSRMK
jgi:hypothetical protein